jgi:hypothetical protein
MVRCRCTTHTIHFVVARNTGSQNYVTSRPSGHSKDVRKPVPRFILTVWNFMGVLFMRKYMDRCDVTSVGWNEGTEFYWLRDCWEQTTNISWKRSLFTRLNIWFWIQFLHMNTIWDSLWYAWNRRGKCSHSILYYIRIASVCTVSLHMPIRNKDLPFSINT